MTNDIKKTTPKDVFMHLLTMIAFYVCVVVFGILMFQYIDIYFPDVLAHGPISSLRRAIRWPISVLVVVFPLYVWLSSYMQKGLIANPEKRELKVRKWLLYLTLFVATMVLVGDLVTLIYQFLSGGLTLPFLLKVLAVFVIASTSFLYYGWNLRKEMPASSNSKMKIFVRSMVALGGFGIAFGFYAAGSPQSERLRQFDERRIGDLSNIQFQIIDYWQTKGRLPANLDELRSDISGFVPPLDPQTGEPYEYRVDAGLSFELCADFKTSNKEDGVTSNGNGKPIPSAPFYSGINESWLHDAEPTCFSRTIDPDRFPPRKIPETF